MKSLAWKEWRESRGYLAALTLWMAFAGCYTIGYELAYGFHAPVGQFGSWALFYTICAATLLAMRAAQGERAEGTLSFSAAMPVSMRRVAAVRLAGAVATLALPVLIAAALLALALATGLVEQAAPRGEGPLPRLPERPTAPLSIALEQLASVTAIAVLGGVELLLLLCVIGNRLRSQAQVGFLGAVLGLGSTIASGLFWYGVRRPYAQLAYGALLPQSLVVLWGYGEANGGVYTDHELATYRWYALALSLPLLAVLADVFVVQYGRRRAEGPAKPRKRLLPAAPLWLRLPPRLPGRWGALVWLELRQSLPLVTFGLLFGVLITVASVVTDPRGLGSMGETVLSEMPHTTAFVGLLWAAVVGSGLYASDLRADLGAFWRSRPISPRAWFWCKFVVGLIAVVGVLDGFTILASWNAPRSGPSNGMSWAYVGCFPIMHAFMYAMAVLGTCWLRRPVLGGFLALIGYAVLSIALTTFPATNAMEPINVYNALVHAERAGRMEFSLHGYPEVYGALVLATVGLSLLASRLAAPLEPQSRWLVRAA